MEIEEANREIEEIYNKCTNYENYIKNDALLEEKTMDEIKSILAEVEKISIEELEKNSSEDFREKLDFISNIKNQIQPVLIQKIRYFTLIGKK